MTLDEMIQFQVLKLKASASLQGRLHDAAVEQAEGKIQLRQMCAKVSPQLYDAVENVCQMLDMSKRQFIEAAVSEACTKAEAQIAEAFGRGQPGQDEETH